VPGILLPRSVRADVVRHWSLALSAMALLAIIMVLLAFTVRESKRGATAI